MHHTILARMDVDDLMQSGQIRRAHGDVTVSLMAAVVSLKWSISSRSSGRYVTYMAWQNKIQNPKDHEREIWIEQIICQPAATMRQTALNRIGGYRDGPFPEDYDLFVRLHVVGYHFYKRGCAGHYWRRHSKSISGFR